MTRPRYETDKDLQGEKEVADYLKEAHQLRCYKMPTSYRLDWIVFAPGAKLHGFMELKTRKVKMNKYPSLLLSLGKYAAGCNLARMTGSGFWVAARWTDTLGFCRVDDIIIDIDIGMGGRTDRGDKDDFEPVVHLPISEFKNFKDTL